MVYLTLCSYDPVCDNIKLSVDKIIIMIEIIIMKIIINKLENCVCKTQVMRPCPKPVLTPCPTLTHDPQHIQSILETNV